MHSSRAFALPEWVCYFNDGWYRARNMKGRVKFQAKPPHNFGYTNAIFRTISTTNLGGLTVPVHFQFYRFAPKGGAASSNESWTIKDVEGWAEKVKKVNTTN